MSKIYTSASKLVFILMALAVTAGMFMKIIEPKDFLSLALMAFTFYFSNKPTNSTGEIMK